MAWRACLEQKELYISWRQAGSNASKSYWGGLGRPVVKCGACFTHLFFLQALPKILNGLVFILKASCEKHGKSKWILTQVRAKLPTTTENYHSWWHLRRTDWLPHHRTTENRNQQVSPNFLPFEVGQPLTAKLRKADNLICGLRYMLLVIILEVLCGLGSGFLSHLSSMSLLPTMFSIRSPAGILSLTGGGQMVRTPENPLHHSYKVIWVKPSTILALYWMIFSGSGLDANANLLTSTKPFN